MSVRWIREAAGAAESQVRLFLRGQGGELQPVPSRLEPAEDPERRTARRRLLESRRVSRVAAPGGHTLASIPLVARRAPVGIVEVIAPSASLEQRWGTVEAVTSHVASVLWNLEERNGLLAEAEGARQSAALAAAMARSLSPREAVIRAVRFCHDRFQEPVAGWLVAHDPSRFELVSARGIGRARANLRGRMRVVDGRELRTAEGRLRATARFAEVADVPGANLIHAGQAVFLLGGRRPSNISGSVESLLEDVLGNVTVVATAERRSRGLDVGLALTAHEIRGPLTGVLASLDYMSMQGMEDPDSAPMLRRSRDQLEQISRLVEGLLRWAVTGQRIELNPTDLMVVVREAVDWSSRGAGASRVVVSGPASLSVRAAPDHLRAAISNVVRNALAYSPPDGDVSVSVASHDGLATVTVHDLGPGVHSADRELIFDPFMRGSVAHLARNGQGLGLFIARRIMEAHDGTIWLGSAPRGAAFHLQLPMTGGL
jgi:signal transduction histidine kinase